MSFDIVAGAPESGQAVAGIALTLDFALVAVEVTIRTGLEREPRKDLRGLPQGKMTGFACHPAVCPLEGIARPGVKRLSLRLPDV